MFQNEHQISGRIAHPALTTTLSPAHNAHGVRIKLIARINCVMKYISGGRPGNSAILTYSSVSLEIRDNEKIKVEGSFLLLKQIILVMVAYETITKNIVQIL